jgi:hypothetical protein
VIHWFRKQDNDPFVIDATELGTSTFTRRILDLQSELWDVVFNDGFESGNTAMWSGANH